MIEIDMVGRGGDGGRREGRRKKGGTEGEGGGRREKGAGDDEGLFEVGVGGGS